jgi:hypothetical protein
MAPQFVGPFKVIEVLSPVSYRLELPPSMRVSAVQHIRNLIKAPDTIGVIPPSEERPFDTPQDRLTPGILEITSIEVLTSDDDVTELSAVTAFGNILVHELCIRGHFNECQTYLGKAKHKWPNFLGRRAELRTTDISPGIGFISAYDPKESTLAYQCEFDDVTLSAWFDKTELKVKHMQRITARRGIYSHQN